MPAPHDLDPPAMTDEERLAKRRYQAYFAFETDVVTWELDPDDDNGFVDHDPDQCTHTGGGES